MGGFANGGGRPRRLVSLHKFTVCLCEDRRERYTCVGRVTYSVAPAAQQVVGQGVLRVQLNGFIQMILGGESDRQTGRRFSLLIHDTAAISTAAFCPDLICPASPTHKYFTNTSHTRNLVERPHTPGCHTPSLVLFHSPL